MIGSCCYEWVLVAYRLRRSKLDRRRRLRRIDSLLEAPDAVRPPLEDEHDILRSYDRNIAAKHDGVNERATTSILTGQVSGAEPLLTRAIEDCDSTATSEGGHPNERCVVAACNDCAELRSVLLNRNQVCWFGMQCLERSGRWELCHDPCVSLNYIPSQIGIEFAEVVPLTIREEKVQPLFGYLRLGPIVRLPGIPVRVRPRLSGNPMPTACRFGRSFLLQSTERST